MYFAMPRLSLTVSVDAYDILTLNEMNHSSWPYFLDSIPAASQNLNYLRMKNIVAMNHGYCYDLFFGSEGTARNFAYKLIFKTF
jgi:hypothetical protein